MTIHVTRRLDARSKTEIAVLTDSYGSRHVVQQPLVLDLRERDENGKVVLDENGKAKCFDRALALEMHQAIIDDAAFDMEKREQEFLATAEALGHHKEETTRSSAVSVARPVVEEDVTECENCKPR